MTTLRLALAALLFTGMAASAKADEQMRVLAESGNWIALSHSDSMIDAPDLCLVSSGDTPAVAFRKDDNTFQLRVSDKDWSLPTGVNGQVTLTVGQWTHTFNIDDNTNDTVNAEIDTGLVDTMFGAMDNASTMVVKVGNAKPYDVSLLGSTVATNAFRTCAGFDSHGNTAGSNPFTN
jgi:hypothetical protein